MQTDRKNANKKKKELERLMKLIDKLESQAQKLEAEMAARAFMTVINPTWRLYSARRRKIVSS